MLESDEDEEDNAEFSMLDPNLIDLDEEDNTSNNDVTNGPVISTTIEHFLLPNETFYDVFTTK